MKRSHLRGYWLLLVFTIVGIEALEPAHAVAQERRGKTRISNAGLTITALPLLAAREWGIFSANGLDIRCEEYLHRNSLLSTPHA